MQAFAYVFTALRGVQAGREYYIAMCPLKLLPKIFLFDEDEIPAELRAQRTLNRARVPEIARYLVAHAKDYVFSAITASIDGEVAFEPSAENGPGHDVGRLSVPMTARFVINDGQHRRAGIEEALKERPELGEETISVVFFIDSGLKRSQQMFADLNTHAIRPTKSLGILYDHRDPAADLARRLVTAIPCFKGLTESEKSTISNRSTKLFTLSSIYQSTRQLLRKRKREAVTGEEEAIATAFWTEVASHMKDWEHARERKVAAAELRRGFIHAHGLALHALSIVGSYLLAHEPGSWRARLKKLEKIDWSRSNGAVWDGRALVGGRVSKARDHVILTANYLKTVLGVPLTPEEQRVEQRHAPHLSGGRA